jgi:hypothetical protein
MIAAREILRTINGERRWISRIRASHSQRLLLDRTRSIG